MAEQVLKNCKLYVGGYNLTGDMNSLTLNYTADIKDATVFGSTYRQRKPGLLDSEITCAGFWNATSDLDKVDQVAFDKVGSSDELITVLPNGTDAGNIAYFGKGFSNDYTINGTVGEMLGFSFAAFGNQDLNRGKVLFQGTLTSETTSPIVNLGKIDTTSLECRVGVHITNVSASDAGASATLEIARSSSTDFSAAATTMYSISLTTASVNYTSLNTSHTHGTSANWSYRCKVLDQDTSDDSWQGMVVIAHQKKL